MCWAMMFSIRAKNTCRAGQSDKQLSQTNKTKAARRAYLRIKFDLDSIIIIIVHDYAIISTSVETILKAQCKWVVADWQCSWADDDAKF